MSEPNSPLAARDLARVPASARYASGGEATGAGMWIARVTTPDGLPATSHVAFDFRDDAERWLDEHGFRHVGDDTWAPRTIDTEDPWGQRWVQLLPVMPAHLAATLLGIARQPSPDPGAVAAAIEAVFGIDSPSAEAGGQPRAAGPPVKASR